MFNKLIDVLMGFIKDVIPAYIILQFEGGVQLRNGKYMKTVGPGLYSKRPFFDTIIKTSVVMDIAFFMPQYITTVDDVTVAIRSVLTWSVFNVKTFLLEIEDAQTGLADSAMGAIAETLASQTWAEIQGGNWRTPLRRTLRDRAKEFGVTIHRVQFATLARPRPFIGLLGTD